MNRLDQIENRIREIVEKSSGFFAWNDEQAVLVHHLCESIQNYLLDENNTIDDSPSVFQVYMHPSDTKLWKQQPDWQDAMANVFAETMSEFCYKLDSVPELTLTAKNSLKQGEIRITALKKLSANEKTGAVNYPNPPQPVKTDGEKYHSAKLLFNDNKLIPLKKAVVNLGRRSTNDIVINDLRISRTHAQIRIARDGYMIFDVDSTGGTFINGERVTNHLLRSGDVISLAGYTMIYTDENNHEFDTERGSTAEISNTNGLRE
ncbi:MAG: FHA domain-containing protein [Chloroflexi bacterium]|nr:MAG: FHA domain-containing protein [Chloroflexota bacterium]